MAELRWRKNLRVARCVRTAFDDDGSAVAISTRRAQYVHMNRPVGRLWRHMLENKCTVAEALPAVAAFYGIPVERLSADMQPVLQKLLANRLLRKVR